MSHLNQNLGRCLGLVMSCLPCLAKDSDEHVQQGDTGENHKKREEPEQSNALLANVAPSVLRMVISCAFVNTGVPK